jgi:hypothetical protein
MIEYHPTATVGKPRLGMGPESDRTANEIYYSLSF